MDALYTSYLSDSIGKELEWRISINKTQYDDVLRFMRDSSAVEHDLDLSLNILLGKNVRISIQGSDKIEHYCARNYIPNEHWNSVTIGTKQNVVRPVIHKNKSKLSLSNETDENFKTLVLNPDMLQEMNPNVKSIVNESMIKGTNRIDLKMYKKLFRLRQRRSFVLGNSVRVDITMVKENASIINISDRKEIQTTLTMKDAQLGKQPLQYELEVELLKADNEAVKDMQNIISELEKELSLEHVDVPMHVNAFYRQAINSMISSHFAYLNDTYGSDDLPEDAPKTEQDAIQKYSGSRKLPYVIPKLVSITRSDLPIQEGMAATDKADGDSCIVMVVQKYMYIFDSGFRQLAPIRKLEDFEVKGLCLFAGEFIKKDKGGFTHTTAYLYDVYIWDANDVRRLNLVSEKRDESTRIKLVQQFSDLVKQSEPAIGDGLRIRCKQMLLGNMMEVSKRIWDSRDNYPYVLDGIILTPAYTPVGFTKENNWEWGYRMNRTWRSNLKWKPPTFNSIDFILVWTSGVTKGVSGLVRKGELRTTETIEQNGIRCTVFPLFQPSEYVRPKAYQIEVPIDASREPRTEEDNRYIRNKSIVECRYDTDMEQWVVLRNREDKTKAWDSTLESLKSAHFKLKKLVELATHHKHSGDWKKSIQQNINIFGRTKVQEQKNRKFMNLRKDLIRFLRFHAILKKDEIEDPELVTICKRNSDKINSLLNDPFVPIPLTYSISGSNNTFVADSIWKSIHEPVRIEHFNSTEESITSLDTDVASGAASGAGSEVISHRNIMAIPSLPISVEVNVELMNVLKRLTKDTKVEHLLLMSDHEVPLRDESMLWTSKVSVRKASNIIRGDIKKIKTRWSTKEDKRTWQTWKETTEGATDIIVIGIPGSLENIKQRKTLIESVTKSASTNPDVKTTMYLVYWDHSKIDTLSSTSWTEVTVGGHTIKAKKSRSGHLIVSTNEDKEYLLYSWPETKFLEEYKQSGWNVTDVQTEFNAVSLKDPLSSFLSLAVLKN